MGGDACSPCIALPVAGVLGWEVPPPPPVVYSDGVRTTSTGWYRNDDWIDRKCRTRSEHKGESARVAETFTARLAYASEVHGWPK